MASSGTTSTRKRFTGAEFIVHFLEQQGIKIVTGIPGGSILPVYDALSQSTQIRHILARHEQGAGFIAQGMARTDGKPAVCMACSGPGSPAPRQSPQAGQNPSCPARRRSATGVGD